MRTFGLIGYPLTHSFSRKYFTEKFERESIVDHVYELYPIENISLFPAVLKSVPTLAGLNVTIPYKEQVIPYLDACSEAVQEIGACNCIKITDGFLTGYNTDVLGFARSLETKLQPMHRKALVLGTGGAAKAVYQALKEKHIEFLKVSRQPGPGLVTYDDIDASIIKEYTLIINTTPLGMYPQTDLAPSLPYHHLSTSHYLFDLVYNPSVTLFLRKGQEYGAITENGADMLHIQAEESWKIWNS